MNLQEWMAPEPARLTMEAFAEHLHAHWDANRKHSEHVKMTIAAMGLAGEAGESLEYFKKYIRDGAEVRGNVALALELGDVAHYWVRCVRATGFTIEQILLMNEQKLARRRAEKEEARAAVQEALAPEEATWRESSRSDAFGVAHD